MKRLSPPSQTQAFARELELAFDNLAGMVHTTRDPDLLLAEIEQTRSRLAELLRRMRAPSRITAEKKPHLVLLSGKDMTPENVAKCFEELTGRRMTAQGLAYARKKLGRRRPQGLFTNVRTQPRRKKRTR